MKPELCTSIQESFSDYLDGAVSGHQMQAISQHLFGESESCDREDSTSAAPCEACSREFVAWRLTQEALAALGPAKAPADLGLRLRLAISHEHARSSVRLRDRVSLAWENAVRPMLVQVSAGFASAVLLVGSIVSLLGYVAVPQPVLANDEPLVATTAPHYLYSTVSSGDIVTGEDAAIVVEAAVDSAGRVYDYAIVSGPRTDDVRSQVENHLLGSVFQPASVFGLPVRSRVVVTFAGISVHG